MMTMAVLFDVVFGAITDFKLNVNDVVKVPFSESVKTNLILYEPTKLSVVAPAFTFRVNPSKFMNIDAVPSSEVMTTT